MRFLHLFLTVYCSGLFREFAELALMSRVVVCEGLFKLKTYELGVDLVLCDRC